MMTHSNCSQGTTMLIFKTRQVIALSFLVLSISALGCADAQKDIALDGEFTDKRKPEQNTKTTTVIKGLVSDKDGKVMADAHVFLVRDNQAIHHAKTDSNGQYTFNQDVVGNLQLVVNTGEGMGALVDIVVFSGGKNTPDPIRVGPIDAIEALVNIAGIGFEQRLTTGAGNYEHPVYSSRGDAVYALRKNDAQPTWTIVHVDTATGQEQVLYKDFERGYKKHLSLYKDQFLFFTERGVVENQFGKDRLKIMDLKSQQIIFDELSGHDEFYAGFEHVKASDKWLYVLYQTEREIKEINEFSSFGIYKNKITRINLQNLATQPVDAFLYEGWGKDVQFHVSRQDALLVSWKTVCFDGANGEADLCDDHETYMYDVGTKKRTDYPNVKRVEHFSQDGALGVTTATQPSNNGSISTVLISTTNGNTRAFDWPKTIDGIDFTHHHLHSLSKDGTLATFKLSKYIPNPNDPMAAPDVVLGTYVLNTQTMMLTPIDQQLVYQQTSYRYCDQSTPGYLQSASMCAWRFDGTNQLNVQGVFVDQQGIYTGFYTENILAQSPKYTFFQLPQIEDAKELVSTPNVQTHPNTGKTIFQLRNVETGFLQIYAQTQGGLIQKTFLKADHQHAYFSENGETLYYFTTDQLSGYQQLFKLDLNALNP